MNGLRQLFLGLLIALGSVLLIFGAASLAVVEGTSVAFVPSASPGLPGITPSPILENQPEPLQTPIPTLTRTYTATAPQPTSCPVPDGWVAYTVQPGDSLSALAERMNLSPDQILKANCMSSSSLMPDTILYLPYTAPTNTVPPALPTLQPTLSPTRTKVSCSPPSGWILYTIQPGEYLYRLAQAFGVTVDQIVAANCLHSTAVFAGQRIFLPNVPTRVPLYTRTPTTTPTRTTAAPTEVSPTAAQTPTSGTPTPATATATLTTAPNTPTATLSSTSTSTNIPNTPTATNTLRPTATDIPTPTLEATGYPVP